MRARKDEAERYAENRRAIRRGHVVGVTPPPGRRPSWRKVQAGKPCRPERVNPVAGARQAVSVLRSPRVPAEVHRRRDAACAACEFALVVAVEEGETAPLRSRLGKETGLLRYCRCCGCGAWRVGREGSDCSAKNAHAAHACPIGRFGLWSGPTAGRGARWSRIPGMLAAAWRAKGRHVGT